MCDQQGNDESAMLVAALWSAALLVATRQLQGRTQAATTGATAEVASNHEVRKALVKR